MRDNPNDSVKNILGPEIENASRLEMANQGDEFEEGQNISRSYEYVDETDIGEDSGESENFDGDDSEAAEPSEEEIELAKDWSQTLEVTSELTDDPVLQLPGFRIGKSGVEKTRELELRGHKTAVVPTLGKINAVECPLGLDARSENIACFVHADSRGAGLATEAER